mgnify:CR=1 FL=1
MLLFGDFILGLLSLADQFSRIKTESFELLNLIEKSVSKVFPYEKSNSSNDFFWQFNKNVRSINAKIIRNFIFSGLLVKLPITENVLAKNGLLCRQFQMQTEPEQKFFRFANIRKKVKGKIFCGYC